MSCLGSNIAGVKEILQYEELMFHPSDNKELADKIKKLLSDRTYVDWIKRLCEERKRSFSFDWKERVFQVTNDTRLSVAKR